MKKINIEFDEKLKQLYLNVGTENYPIDEEDISYIMSACKDYLLDEDILSDESL